MKNKFRMTVVMMIAFMMVFTVTGCGNSGGKVKGETFDGGNIEVFVPEGWAAYHGPDIFDDYEEGYNPNVVYLGKGSKSDADLFNVPMVNITYSADKSMVTPTKDYYEEAKDIKDIETDEYTWKGFTAVSMGYPVAILFAEKGDVQIQVNVSLEGDEDKVTVEDADFIAILNGIKAK